MSDVVDRLRGIAGQATPGPWELKCGPSVYMDGTRAFDIRKLDVPGIQVNLTATRPNAEHIGTFDPVLVAAMLDVIEAVDTGESCGCSTLCKALVRFREVAS